MYIQIVQFRLNGMTDAQYHAQAEAVAPVFSQLPGLISKVWLANPTTNTFGGVYTWRDRESLEQYRASEIYERLTSNAHYADLADRDFGILTAPTRASLPLAQGVEA
jgi:hypothetical protein